MNDFNNESEGSSMVGLVVKSYSKQESHYKSKESLSNYLRRNNVIALENIDTRSLVRKLSEFGTMTGFITSNDVDSDFV